MVVVAVSVRVSGLRAPWKKIAEHFYRYFVRPCFSKCGRNFFAAVFYADPWLVFHFKHELCARTRHRAFVLVFSSARACFSSSLVAVSPVSSCLASLEPLVFCVRRYIIVFFFLLFAPSASSPFVPIVVYKWAAYSIPFFSIIASLWPLCRPVFSPWHLDSGM